MSRRMATSRRRWCGEQCTPTDLAPHVNLTNYCLRAAGSCVPVRPPQGWRRTLVNVDLVLDRHLHARAVADVPSSIESHALEGVGPVCDTFVVLKERGSRRWSGRPGVGHRCLVERPAGEGELDLFRPAVSSGSGVEDGRCCSTSCRPGKGRARSWSVRGS